MAENPPRLFHGTPYEIHTSERPFLDPHLAVGRDDGDPEGEYVFATPDLLIASVFAFKDSDCKSIVRTAEGPVAVFNGTPPARDAEGFVFEVLPEGFKQTLRRNVPSGKWALVAQDMPRVTDVDGSEVPGLPLSEPVRRVFIRDLIKQDKLRVCLLTDAVDAATYSAAIRDAIHAEMETTFISEAIECGWLYDITGQYFEDASGGGTN